MALPLPPPRCPRREMQEPALRVAAPSSQHQHPPAPPPQAPPKPALTVEERLAQAKAMLLGEQAALQSTLAAAEARAAALEQELAAARAAVVQLREQQAGAAAHHDRVLAQIRRARRPVGRWGSLLLWRVGGRVSVWRL